MTLSKITFSVTVVIFLLAFVFLGNNVYGVADDGFSDAEKIEGKHVIVYYPKGFDIAGLDRQLNIGPADKILTGRQPKIYQSPEAELADTLDTLFNQVCDIIDMRLYSLQVNIKVCRDEGQLDKIYRYLFNDDLHGRKSFYVYSFNTIYVSQGSFTREILGHEMAHAIISHYFVVPPPIKVQEILAGYVEYSLRKSVH